MTARFDGHDPSSGHDTARVPWEGRDVTASPFAGDDGTADRAVRAAVSRVACAEEAARIEAEVTLMARLAGARLLVPVVAEPGTADQGAASPADDRSDMASIVLTAPDGGRAMPVFTGIDALTAWNGTARPVPVAAADAARAAIEDGCVAVPIDLGSDRVVALRLSHLWALAQERDWAPPGRDPLVADALRRIVAADARITRVEVNDGPHGRAEIVLVLVPGLAPDDVRGLAAGVGEALADPGVRVRLDEVALVVRSA